MNASYHVIHNTSEKYQKQNAIEFVVYGFGFSVFTYLLDSSHPYFFSVMMPCGGALPHWLYLASIKHLLGLGLA